MFFDLLEDSKKEPMIPTPFPLCKSCPKHYHEEYPQNDASRQSGKKTSD